MSKLFYIIAAAREDIIAKGFDANYVDKIISILPNNKKSSRSIIEWVARKIKPQTDDDFKNVKNDIEEFYKLVNKKIIKNPNIESITDMNSLHNILDESNQAKYAEKIKKNIDDKLKPEDKVILRKGQWIGIYLENFEQASRLLNYTSSKNDSPWCTGRAQSYFDRYEKPYVILFKNGERWIHLTAPGLWNAEDRDGVEDAIAEVKPIILEIRKNLGTENIATKYFDSEGETPLNFKIAYERALEKDFKNLTKGEIDAISSRPAYCVKVALYMQDDGLEVPNKIIEAIASSDGDAYAYAVGLQWKNVPGNVLEQLKHTGRYTLELVKNIEKHNVSDKELFTSIEGQNDFYYAFNLIKERNYNYNDIPNELLKTIAKAPLDVIKNFMSIYNNDAGQFMSNLKDNINPIKFVQLMEDTPNFNFNNINENVYKRISQNEHASFYFAELLHFKNVPNIILKTIGGNYKLSYDFAMALNWENVPDIIMNRAKYHWDKSNKNNENYKSSIKTLNKRQKDLQQQYDDLTNKNKVNKYELSLDDSGDYIFNYDENFMGYKINGVPSEISNKLKFNITSPNNEVTELYVPKRNDLSEMKDYIKGKLDLLRLSIDEKVKDNMGLIK